MDIALKKNQSFRLSVDLIGRLKQLAKRQNRSLNNYVETNPWAYEKTQTYRAI